MTYPIILLTGATGFIGGATLAHLLQFYPGCRLVLLVRAASEGEGVARIRKSLGRFMAPEQVETTLQSCDLLCGDLTDMAALGNPSALDNVTHVLHLASNTSFRSVKGVRHANILGALALAHRMRRVKGLQRFVYVGTAYICGEDSNRIVHEDDFPRYGVNHVCEYTSSKAECEMLLEATAPELPLVVARPSVVVGHTKLGCGPSSSIFWFYRTADLLRRLTCPLETYDDVVPADYVAAALVHLLFKPQLKYRRYHISAGEDSSVTWQEIADAFSNCHGERSDNPYRIMPFAEIEQERDRLGKFLGPGSEDHMLMALRIYFRFMEINVELFSNRRLLEEGMPPPPKFTSYLPLCAERPAGRSVYQQMLDDE